MQNEPTPDPAAQPRKWRRGDVGPDGRVFWARAKGSPNGEYWVTPDKVPALRAKAQEAARKVNERDRANGWARIREWALKNPDKVKASKRKNLTPDRREEASLRVKAWRARNPDKVRAHGAAAYEKTKLDPHKRALKLLRQRLWLAVSRGWAGKVPRSADRETVRFLLWLARRNGHSPVSGQWHIDHLIPLSRLPAGAAANAPENVRWLLAEHNLKKAAEMPSAEEVAEHLALVEEWKKETRSQKTA